MLAPSDASAGTQFGNVGGGEGFVHLTGPGPGDDFFLRLFRGVLRQILIRNHDDRITLGGLDNVERVRGGAANIGDRFDGGGGVHIGDNGHPGILRAHGHNVFRRDRGGERAAGAAIGDEHGFFRVQQF